MPTSAATDLAVRSLSPVSSTGESPRARSCETAWRLVALTRSATAIEPARLAVPGDGHDRGAVGLEAFGLGGERAGQRHAPVVEEAGLADDDDVAVDDRLDTSTGSGQEVLGDGQGAKARASVLGDGAGDRVLARRPRRSRPGAAAPPR